MSSVQPGPQHVQPQPTPETWEIYDQQMPDGSMVTLVQIHSVTGNHISWLAPEFAQQIGMQIAESGTRGKSKILLPPAGFQLPTIRKNGHRE